MFGEGKDGMMLSHSKLYFQRTNSENKYFYSLDRIRPSAEKVHNISSEEKIYKTNKFLKLKAIIYDGSYGPV